MIGEDYFIKVLAENQAGVSESGAELDKPAKAKRPIGEYWQTLVVYTLTATDQGICTYSGCRDNSYNRKTGHKW